MVGSCNTAMPGSCTASTEPEHTWNDPGFYEGILKRGTDAEEADSLFTVALESPNPHVVAAAAAILMERQLDDGIAFPEETRALIGAAATGSWKAAFDALEEKGTVRGKEDALALMLDGGTETAVLRAMAGRARGNDITKTAIAGFDFTDAEKSAILGRLAVTRSGWSEALAFFRITLKDSPDIFFRHPDLIGSLGRAFMSTSTGTEGAKLFVELDKIAETGGGNWRGKPMGVVNPGNESEIRFRLLFYAGRISRQRGNDGTAYFEKALPFAREVSPEQSDATIWYILRTAVDRSPDAMIDALEKHVSGWHDDAGFLDVMDILSRQLIMKRQWDRLVRVLAAVKDRRGVITSKFAWIVARAVQEGLIPKERVGIALGFPPSEPPETALLRIAYETGHRSLYYRLMSANAIGEPFLPLSAVGGPDTNIPERSYATRFLLGFFENGAERFAMPYIRALEGSLTLDELRPVVEAVASTGDYLASISLIGRHTRREAFDFSAMTRRDWELWYPTPFADLIEGHSGTAGVEPHMMFALVRAESAFMPAIGSHAGARGLSQLMQATADETATRIRRQGGPDLRRQLDNGTLGLDLTDPSVNLRIGATYLAMLMNERFGGEPLIALMAYNAGQGRVRQWLTGAKSALGFTLPPDLFLETVTIPETRNYGRGVTSATEVYRQLYFAGESRRIAGR